MSSSSSVSIQALLKKTEHYDKDERYMATSDLCEVLKRAASSDLSSSTTTNASSSSSSSLVVVMDSATEKRICSAVLRLLHDKSNDVQAIAVKTLGVLLTTVQEEQVIEIADRLTDQVLDVEKSELRDVYAIGLRTLCQTVPATMGDAVSQRLVGRLLEGIRSSGDEEIVLCCLEILTDVLDRFGASSLSVTRQHEAILQLCLQQLASEAHVVRKRAGTTLGCLSVVLSDALLARMVESLLSQMDVASSSSTSMPSHQGGGGSDTRALIRTMCTVSGAVGHRLGQAQIDRILPIFLKFCDPQDAMTGDDDDAAAVMMMMEEDASSSQDGDAVMMQDEEAVALANELRESCFTGFESFVSRCPNEVEPHLDAIVQAALAYMSYDPNYSYGDDEEEAAVEEEDEELIDEEAEDEDEIEEEEEEDDEFDDDDDDDSWKVRRSAIRALTAVVEAKEHDPAILWTKVYAIRKGKTSTVATALVGRFKEREENCRVDLIHCFTRLLSVTVKAAEDGVVSFASPDVMDTGDDVIDLRSSYRPALVKACEKLLGVKKGGERSKSAVLSLLSTLCLAPGGVGGRSEIIPLFQHIKVFLSVTGAEGQGFHHRETASKTLKLEALRLVRVMMACGNHDSVHIKMGVLQTLLEDVCASVNDKWYKVTAEALRVLAEVPRIILTGYTRDEDPSEREKEMNQVATSIFDAIEPYLAARDVDQIIKECALSACGALLSSLHTNLTSEQRERLLSLLLDRLRNETTRISAIKTLSAVAAASDSNRMDEVNKIDLSLILGEAISAMSSFLKQQSRSLKQSTLEALDVIVTHHGSEDASLQDGELFSGVLQQIADLIVDSDLHLSHLSLRVSISILKECPACAPAVKAYILPPALTLSTSPLLQDLALDSLVALLEQMVVGKAVEFSELLQALQQRCESEEKVGKHAVANLAMCMAVITAATTEENRLTVVMDILSKLEGAEDTTDEVLVKDVVLSLRMSGDLGRVVDLGRMEGVAGRLQKIYLGCFDWTSEEVKHAAAYALGSASFGAQTVLLPSIVDALETNKEKKQYLLLSALREFIRCNLRVGSDAIAPSVPVILPHLLNHCSDSEEGVRTMVAECMGSLTCLQPAGMLQTLRDLIVEHIAISAPGGQVAEGDETSKTNALACWTAATSIKLAIAGKVSAPDLAAYMPEYLGLMHQEELAVRNAALLMVYSAVHHMPQLVSGMMKDLILPSLYEVSELTLKRKVDLGPFTHTVDDALPLRKSALSIFATCLENMPGSLDIAAFMPVLAKALFDLEDVQLQAHQVVISMCTRQPSYLVAAIESFVEPLEKTINKKTGQKSGTELERAQEWIKSGLRAMIALSRLDGSMSSRKFVDFLERTKGNSKFRPMLEALEEER